ncbi:bifunctional methylenetetrahydrofolate dehydrogenase/methenyltetrahydrofolate cyclohydrolase FolD [Marininema halotolerans]|uniref:Bifunctional protein FolD n=1 Tax=Marininema halotolerans TaxID=1155944 RepID=A0A1I6TV56_9BACL|nr:bifunctional methylenetetrahydrofolate dehydrogenase/methenyltetrahydrofolate cyclohydrolase FolD [Marininema halotolerans]SFS93119.1 methylenetetrahydrofolate dehydrogenase (NADP+) / methenyltetrahydrofolate cyclohydrolase [Marininema halotolerans]
MNRGQIIDGKAIAAQVKSEVRSTVGDLAKQGITPGLAVVLVGNDPASETYVRGKIRDCEEVGIHSELIRLPAESTEEELLAVVAQLNDEASIHGILVQLPLPSHIPEERIIAAICPEKDVDCFHPMNVGRLATGLPTLLPCTPHGIIEMLKRTGIEIAGKHAVVVGRSNIVGKPISFLLQQHHATVTMCHSRSGDLASYTREADILVAAVGKTRIITADMIKPGAVVIDVGMNRDENGKLAGDVDFTEAKKVASYITPVPGGVGPMTRAMLLVNACNAAASIDNR